MKVAFEKVRTKLASHWNHLSRGAHARIIGGGVLVLAGLIILPAFKFWIGPAIKTWRVERAIDQAAAFDAAQDYRNLLLSVRRVSTLGSTDVEVWRSVAGYLSKLGDPNAIAARRQVIALTPRDHEAQVELAADALRFGEITLGQQALEAVPDTVARRDATYQRIAGTLALYLGDVENMKSHLAEVITLDPQDATARFDLAAAQLWSPRSEDRATGRATLDELLSNPDQRVRAALELLKDAARDHDGRRAADVVERVIQRFPPLPIRATGASDLDRMIAALQLASRTQPGDAALLASWLSDIRRGTDAMGWLKVLPAETRLHVAVREVTTELALRLNDFDTATELLLQGTFGPISSQTLVLALSARQLEIRQRTTACQVAWTEAIATAATDRRPGSLRVLARIALLWGKPAWVEAAVNKAIDQSPQSFWAFSILRDQWLTQGETKKLWELYDRWVQRQPEDLNVVSQWLRLGSALPDARAALDARAESYLQQLPASPRTTAALAGWRWRQGREAEARSLLAQAGEGVYYNPDSAFWAAVITGSTEPVRDFPALARLQTLPVENALLTGQTKRP
ncbi:tetratricopeptide repeat protein [Synoicihabitans lomoniglobus]|uniref:Tetratricopeptide repeat protein n=1 Tax=Synoicihabitans lomoniglobus TaxID=2909285 RepID=A0AAF0CQM3_9BACT|nr:hypothetical protein [Opitutaceae bacterium LMO-M01]WED66280.1 hypothetical protein PXH66_05390 [Opitutaceae bacterium LMO-M01]